MLVCVLGRQLPMIRIEKMFYVGITQEKEAARGTLDYVDPRYRTVRGQAKLLSRLRLSKNIPHETLRPSNTPPGRPPSVFSLRQPRHLNARGVRCPTERLCFCPTACTFAGLGGDVRIPRGSLQTLPGKIAGNWQRCSHSCVAHIAYSMKWLGHACARDSQTMCLAVASARLRYPSPR